MWGRREPPAPRRPSPLPTPDQTAVRMDQLARDIQHAAAEVSAVAKILKEERQ
jgi:hypothetical protein